MKNVILGLLIFSSTSASAVNCTVGVFEEEYEYGSKFYKKLSETLALEGISIDRVGDLPAINYKNDRTGCSDWDYEEKRYRSCLDKKDLYMDRVYTTTHETKHGKYFDVHFALYATKKLNYLSASDVIFRSYEQKQIQQLYQREAGTPISAGEFFYNIKTGLTTPFLKNNSLKIEQDEFNQLIETVKNYCKQL